MAESVALFWVTESGAFCPWDDGAVSNDTLLPGGYDPYEISR